ncbi:hypothetical protein MNBD_GAMMA21-977 [hydrothermal vent metagenome]|uniref:Uncharacterized protein n=1 Tax=hydrothermal vent metagenome TaxID=652676 RepID=A0A3B1AGZ8_9ZZZZ
MRYFSLVKLIILMIALLILTGQWAVIFYFGAVGAIAYIFIISLLAAFIVRPFLLWGKSIYTPLNFKTFWKPLLIGVTLMSTISYGEYFLVGFYQTGLLNTIAFIPWVVVFFVFPVVYFTQRGIRHNLALRNRARNYIQLHIRIGHSIHVPIIVDHLRFVNSRNGKESVIRLPAYRDDSSYDYDEQEQNEMDLALKIESAERVCFVEETDIPFGADIFYMSWYSLVEDTYFQDEFPFSLDDFSFRISKYDGAKQLRSKAHYRQNAGMLSLRIHPLGYVSLYEYSSMLLCYVNAKTKNITGNAKKTLLRKFRPYGRFPGLHNAVLPTLPDEYRKKHFELRYLVQNRVFDWCLCFDGLHENTRFDIDDASYFNDRFKSEELAKIKRAPLPEKIEIMYSGNGVLWPWLLIYIDVDKLNQALKELFSNNEASPVEFLVVVEDNETNDITFFINANGQSVEFNDWQSRVQQEYKEKIKKLMSVLAQEESALKVLAEAWKDVKSKDFKAAAGKCDTLLAMTPVNPQVYFLQGSILRYTEGPSAFMDKLDYLLEKADEDVFTTSRLNNYAGCMLDDQRQYSAALTYFVKASSIDPDDGMYLANIAEIYYKLKKPKKALQFVQKALAKNHQNDMINEIIKNDGVIS